MHSNQTALLPAHWNSVLSKGKQCVQCELYSPLKCNNTYNFFNNKRNSSQSSSLCPGGCALSNCQACYYSYNKLPLPTGAESCPAQCKTGNNMIDENCAAKWGRCLRSIFYATYNQVSLKC